MLSQRIEENRDPADRYIEAERDLLLEAECCRDLVLAMFRLAVIDVYRRRSRRSKEALQFLRGAWAAKLADLIGLESTAIAREALRIQRELERRPRRSVP